MSNRKVRSELILILILGTMIMLTATFAVRLYLNKEPEPEVIDCAIYDQKNIYLAVGETITLNIAEQELPEDSIVSVDGNKVTGLRSGD